ncbi:MAG: hypothetical protein ACRED1_12725, partial [Limisphaerales bacterium]
LCDIGMEIANGGIQLEKADFHGAKTVAFSAPAMAGAVFARKHRATDGGPTAGLRAASLWPWQGGRTRARTTNFIVI